MKAINQILFIVLTILLFSCNANDEAPANSENSKEVTNLDLDLAQANRLASLPLHCIQKEYPNKPGVVYEKAEDIASPKAQHPAFYGCFDWHSAVHGHWVLVRLLKNFDNLEQDSTIRQMLAENLTADNIQKEIEYFSLNPFTSSFERTYGWAWLFKLTEELKTWDNPQAQDWYKNLQPLTDLMIEKYTEYLPKLNYPIRVGEHSNTAFGLTFAWDYAKAKVGPAVFECSPIRLYQSCRPIFGN